MYRRFNNANLGEADGRDTLRFSENVRHDYLMAENNKEGGLTDEFVNYVGMGTADKATGDVYKRQLLQFPTSVVRSSLSTRYTRLE